MQLGTDGRTHQWATTGKRCVTRRWTTRSRRNSDGSQAARCAIGSSSACPVLEQHGLPWVGLLPVEPALLWQCCSGGCSADGSSASSGCRRSALMTTSADAGGMSVLAVRSFVVRRRRRPAGIGHLVRDRCEVEDPGAATPLAWSSAGASPTTGGRSRPRPRRTGITLTRRAPWNAARGRRMASSPPSSSSSPRVGHDRGCPAIVGRAREGCAAVRVTSLTEAMAFGQPAGPPATSRQVDELLELLHTAGHESFRDLRPWADAVHAAPSCRQVHAGRGRRVHRSTAGGFGRGARAAG